MKLFQARKTLLVIAMLSLSTLACAQAIAQDTRTRKDCQLKSRPQWQDRNLVWDGPCKNGKADGTGVLKAYSKAKDSPEIFYGQVLAGALHFGVLEIAGGYQAGPFVDGVVQDNIERNQLIQAFDVGSAAALAYSERLQKAGNVTSARWYAKKARSLAEQLD